MHVYIRREADQNYLFMPCCATYLDEWNLLIQLYFAFSLGSIFAGGLSCGIYTTNSAEIVSYISNHAPLTIMVLEDVELLQRILKGRTIEDAFPTVRKVILVNDNGLIKSQSLLSDKVISWKTFMDLGRSEGENQLMAIEKDQVVNEACIEFLERFT